MGAEQFKPLKRFYSRDDFRSPTIKIVGYGPCADTIISKGTFATNKTFLYIV
jgi:hypothetical protein